MMDQTFKYLTHSPRDESWGLYLNVAGSAEVLNGEIYPPIGHPDNYNFNWKEGRILDEYQILYITKGTGSFETKSKKYKVKEGDIILLFPFVWHRYCPDGASGWTEHYVGFNGNIAKQVMAFFSPENPLLYIGFNEQVFQAYSRLLELINDEQMGFQQAASGYVLFILGTIKQVVLNQAFANNKIEKIINRSRLYMRSHISEQFSIEVLANELNISYSSFRTEFKKYTGISPGQYLLQLKLQTAKNQLSNSFLTVKEVSFNSGFESPFYFSKIFKKHVGLTPTEFRKKGERSRF